MGEVARAFEAQTQHKVETEFGAAALAAMPRAAQAQQTVTDSAGRSVTLPPRIGRIFAAGGAAAVAGNGPATMTAARLRSLRYRSAYLAT